ncbi:tripartite motif-containing protein 59-like [Littorina saxatilis]|uniref:tripartite motif-containing protein 59-like n=1 Tax=Littorina saxatilis TaxID=31220 RepID=UPI0038B5C8BB
MAASTVPVNHLSCSLCLDTLKNPKLLQCHHTFCEACLLGLRDNVGNNYLHCPQCRKGIKLSRDGIRRLQTNFYLTPLLEQQQDVCGEHPGEELRFVCVPCNKAICRTCLLQHHNQHELQDLEKAMKNAKAKLKKIPGLVG